MAVEAPAPPEAETRPPHPEVWSWGDDPRSVHQRMCDVLAELPAIGKTQRNEQQKFMYRGHDDVMNALNPLLAKHGVFFTPRVLERVTAERTTSRNSTMYEVNLLVEYTFWGANGDSIVASAWGEGTDMGDKSTNKAMTMALKNVLAQSFALATEELSDAESNSPEETSRGGGRPAGATGRSDRHDREEEFNPGTMLLPNAVRGDDYAQQLLDKLDKLAADLEWQAIFDVAATAALGPKSKRTDTQKQESIYRWSNAVAKMELLAEASDGYHPELGLPAGEKGDAIVKEAIKFAYGYELSGDLPRRPEAATDSPAEDVPAAEEASERAETPSE